MCKNAICHNVKSTMLEYFRFFTTHSFLWLKLKIDLWPSLNHVQFICFVIKFITIRIHVAKVVVQLVAGSKTVSCYARYNITDHCYLILCGNWQKVLAARISVPCQRKQCPVQNMLEPKKPNSLITHGVCTAVQ